MTPNDSLQEPSMLYRHIELKFENIAQSLLLSKVHENDNVLSVIQTIVEGIFVRTAMTLANNNITKASKLLGISRNTLSRKLRESRRLS